MNEDEDRLSLAETHRRTREALCAAADGLIEIGRAIRKAATRDELFSLNHGGAALEARFHAAFEAIRRSVSLDEGYALKVAAERLAEEVAPCQQ